MQTLFSSKIIKNPEHSRSALQYYLEQAIPKGSIICVLHPKTILTELLPQIAKHKNCKIICYNGTKEINQILIKTNLLITDKEPDIYITEPDALTPGGALIRPKELSDLQNKKLIGIAPLSTWTTNKPETHDYIQLHLAITELGIHTPQDLNEEINAFS